MTKKVSVFSKYEKVRSLIKPYGKVAVAFSGGVDSTLLLYAAIEELGKENVTALHGKSCLNQSEYDIKKLHSHNFEYHNKLIILDLTPLTWPDFTENDKERCYYCKKRTYKTFRQHLAGQGNVELFDGTNSDDLLQDRPGLAVLKEMRVKTPLADAGLTKKDVRFLAHAFNLSNYQLPSNSCLATRLSPSLTIDPKKLEIVEIIETELKKMGFSGCRAKLSEHMIILEIRQQDYFKISQRYNRIAIQEVCNNVGFATILLDLKGRP